VSGTPLRNKKEVTTMTEYRILTLAAHELNRQISRETDRLPSKIASRILERLNAEYEELHAAILAIERQQTAAAR
jgi:hypothetical protein